MAKESEKLSHASNFIWFIYRYPEHKLSYFNSSFAFSPSLSWFFSRAALH